MVNGSGEFHPKESEISIIDLAVVMVGRWPLFLSTLLLVFLSGVLLAVLKPLKYDFVSLLQVSMVDAEVGMEPPAATLASVQSQWLPEIQMAYRSESGERLPFEVVVSNPENTSLIRLTSRTNEANEELIKEIHNLLLEKVLLRQLALQEKYLAGLREREKALENTLSQVKEIGGDDAGVIMADLFERQAALTEKINSIMPAEVLVIARQGIQPKGPSKGLIVGLASILALMLAVFSVFCAEFAVRVKAALAR